jgi:Flp pilus assembly secretin CpaC
MKIAIRTAALALMLTAGAHETRAMDPGTSGQNMAEPVIVTVDRARVFRVSRPAATVIIGNPSIADATVEDERTLVLTGRSFGVTNLIILDIEGNPIVDQTLVVKGHETNTVRIYRRSSRETLACAPVCEPTLTIGDDANAFAFANTQIRARNELSEGGAN